MWDGPPWRNLAACNQPDVDPVWFDGDRDQVPTRAMRICAGCPVRVNCLLEALSLPSSDDSGVWGGTTAAARKEVRMKRMSPGRAMGLGDRIGRLRTVEERQAA